MSEINVATMERAELEQTAKDLSLSFAHNISDDKLREKINEALGDGGSTDNAAGDTTPSETQSSDSEQAEAPEKRYEILIATHDQDKQPVPIGVNGKTTLIQRGKKVIVPESVVEVLQNAVQHQYDPGTMERTDVLSYPFQIIREV